jgi:putative ABC transport system ATP-binding protein
MKQSDHNESGYTGNGSDQATHVERAVVVSSETSQPVKEQQGRPTVQGSQGRIVGSQPKDGPVIAVRNLKKTYMLGQTAVNALRSVSLDIYPGEFVAVRGPSGSGKSTFMNIIGCLDRPTKGEYYLEGKLVSKMSSDQLAKVRNRLIGFVFQGFNLLMNATALSNVMLPMIYAGVDPQVRRQRAIQALNLVNLGTRLDHRPAQLSGGQQQRVAIARSLVNAPSILLADEPTGNLDSLTSVEIMSMLQELNRQGLTIVLVTHEPDIAEYTSRQITFRDGRLIRDELTPNIRDAQREFEIMEKERREAEAEGRIE